MYPGNTPKYPPGATVGQRQIILAEYNNALCNYHICNRTEKNLKIMLENAIEKTCLVGIYTEIQGFGNLTMQYIFMNLCQTHGRITTA